MPCTSRIDTQGTAQMTENALDMRIDGKGYFQVQLPDGTNAYTRAGNFSRSAEGQLVTAQGYALQPPLQIPAGAQSLTIAPDGTVSAVTPGNAEATLIGQLSVATFINPAGLRNIGDNFLVETAASGPAEVGFAGENGRGQIRQGMLEASNVNVVEELVNMIETQRAYEMNSKAIATADKMLEYVSNTL